MKPTFNLVGERVHNLTIIKFDRWDIRKNYRMPKWWCKCECGVIKSISQNSLRAKTVKSCGCVKNKEAVRKKLSKPEGTAAFNALYSAYKRSAKNRKYPFLLLKEDFRTLTQKNCHYCGIEPSQFYPAKSSKQKYNGRYRYNGIDRKDNSKGYELKNCLPCCGTCNNAKKTLGYAKFISWIMQIREHFLIVDVDYFEN